MSIKTDRMDRLHRLQIAATSFDHERTISLTANLFRLLGERSIIAQNLLKCDVNNHEAYANLSASYEYVDINIKKLLGLE